jgi:flagellar biosynthesis/type III secretory pathway ATPase
VLQESEHTAFQQLVRDVFPNYANHYSANPMLDQAISVMPAIDEFLNQDMMEPSNLDDAIKGLHAIFGLTPEQLANAMTKQST